MMNKQKIIKSHVNQTLKQKMDFNNIKTQINQMK